MARLYGYKPDPHDPRDKPAAALLAALPEPPPRFSLRARAGHALDQTRSDCVANSTAKAVQIALTGPSGLIAPLPSRDWLYYLAGIQEQSQRDDNGRYIRDAFTTLSHLGWPDEAVWPYGKWPAHPGGEAHRAAFDRRAQTGIAYHRVTETGQDRIDAVKRLIAAGYPLVGDVMATPAFEAQDGLSPLPSPDGFVTTNHAVCFADYEPEGVRLINSWGDWADQGWGFLSWGWLTFSADLWAVEILPGAKAVQS